VAKRIRDLFANIYAYDKLFKGSSTRLIKKKLINGIIKPDYDNKNGFQVVYKDLTR